MTLQRHPGGLAPRAFAEARKRCRVRQRPRDHLREQRKPRVDRRAPAARSHCRSATRGCRRRRTRPPARRTQPPPDLSTRTAQARHWARREAMPDGWPGRAPPARASRGTPRLTPRRARARLPRVALGPVSCHRQRQRASQPSRRVGDRFDQEVAALESASCAPGRGCDRRAPAVRSAEPPLDRREQGDDMERAVRAGRSGRTRAACARSRRPRPHTGRRARAGRVPTCIRRIITAGLRRPQRRGRYIARHSAPNRRSHGSRRGNPNDFWPLTHVPKIAVHHLDDRPALARVPVRSRARSCCGRNRASGRHAAGRAEGLNRSQLARGRIDRPPATERPVCGRVRSGEAPRSRARASRGHRPPRRDTYRLPPLLRFRRWPEGSASSSNNEDAAQPLRGARGRRRPRSARGRARAAPAPLRSRSRVTPRAGQSARVQLDEQRDIAAGRASVSRAPRSTASSAPSTSILIRSGPHCLARAERHRW